MRRQPKKPTDYVRCNGCGRLVEKKNATFVGKKKFGRECLQKALRAAEALERETVPPAHA